MAASEGDGMRGKGPSGPGIVNEPSELIWCSSTEDLGGIFCADGPGTGEGARTVSQDSCIEVLAWAGKLSGNLSTVERILEIGILLLSRKSQLAFAALALLGRSLSPWKTNVRISAGLGLVGCRQAMSSRNSLQDS